MNAETLRDLSPDELDTKSQDLREQLLKLRFQQSTGQIENPQMLRAVRKDIARVMTVRREKELGAAAILAAELAATVEAEVAATAEAEVAATVEAEVVATAETEVVATAEAEVVAEQTNTED